MRRAILAVVAPATMLAVAGCSSTQDVLEPSALTSGQPAQTTPAAQNPQPDAPAAAAAIPAQTRVHLAPVIGAADDVAAPLSARFAVRARETGLQMVAAGDSSATHVLRGYFSAFTENGRTTVIYVWDVVDPTGNRVHRIQGQQQAAAGGGDGWAAVQPAVMEQIADRTVEQLAAWLSSRAG